MKTRFNTYDIICAITELQKYVGMRVNNVYDIDNHTYLFKLHRTDEKIILLLESGNRFHLTNYEWPKNVAPSGFSMKLRKHLRNKRLENLVQLGTDRIVDLQFGTGEAAYHVILELYDRGNIVLCDYEMTILNVLRPHTEGDKFRFAVREKYPQNRARESATPTIEDIQKYVEKAKVDDNLKKVLMPNLEYGPALIEHVLLKHGFKNAKIGKTFGISTDMGKLYEAILEADKLMADARTQPSKGFIIQKKEERPKPGNISEKEYFYVNQEFHPLLYQQHSALPNKEFETFNLAVDEFFSTLQGQKFDLKALQQEREAIKKLENVRKDHDKRLQALEKTQETDKLKAELITKNQRLVDNAIVAIQSVLANQVSWPDIEAMVKAANKRGDGIAKQIKQLKLNINHITLSLSDPYYEGDKPAPPVLVDVDLALTAFSNARRYYDQKRSAAKKQQKTIESSSKALKSAEKKTKQLLKEVQTTTNINKARKIYWFEKFIWFISSENYLVIGGRDQQQNELIVKRYMKPNDIYVHADIHGASSIIIKNPTGAPVPPKTLNEAGTVAVCYSVAWDAKVLSNAYWVLGEQVSKTAPTGEYLTTGSFMIRGKKHFLPPSQLILGLGFLFRLEDASVERHKDERRVLNATEELEQFKIEDSAATQDEEIIVSEDEDDNEESTTKEPDDLKALDVISEVTEPSEEPAEEKSSDEEQTSDSDDDDDDENKSNFPDTKINIKHFQGTTKIDIDAKPLIKEEESALESNNTRRNRTLSTTSTNSKSSVTTKTSESSQKVKQPQLKRGQKSKLKKIKEKYRDQDEEERELRMTILQSAGTTKKISKKNKNNQSKSQPRQPRQPQQPRVKSEQDDNEESEPVVQADVDMIDALTGLPVIEDELLFAVPVVAPYNTLTNYKFKVKITPGTSKRGKASKTAVNMFIHEKTTTQREKDLLKAVKDELLARNLPGKVKLSAPRLQASRK